MKEPEEFWTTVGGVSMFGRRYIDGERREPTVVLVHGLSVSGRYMLPTARALAPYYPTFVPDLPGFGKSAKPARILDIPQLTDALAEWLRLSGLSQTCLVGNSLGCQFIVDLALRYPELVATAVLVGPTMDPQGRTLWKEARRAARDMIHEPIGYWPLLTWEYLVAGPVRTVVTLKYAIADPVQEKLSSVRIPVLVVRGEKDPIAPERWAEEMVKRLPQGRLLVIPGAAHVPNYSAGDTLAAAVRAFLEELAGSRPSHL